MARLNDDNQRKLHGSASLERVAVKDGLRLARQGLTQALLLARLLGSGLGLAAVQPVLPILLIGSTLAAAQAQQETTQEPLDKVVIRQLRQTTEGGQSQLLLLIEFDEVDNADTYELQIREKMKGEPAEGQAWSGPDLRSRQLESHGEHKWSPSFPSGVYEVRVQAVPENGSSQYQRGPWSEIREFQLGPETVKDLEVTAGNKSLKVTWKAANYAQNGYRVRWREKGVGALLGKETVTGTSFTIPDLTNGTSYVVRVDTRNNGNGDDVPGTGITECCFEPTEADNHEPIVENEITDPMATTVGMDFNYMFPANTFSDPDKNTLTYSATKSDGSPLPSWLNFNPATRTFSGTPPAWDPGTLMVKVIASDGLDSVYDIFGIRVRPLTITNITITSIDTQDIIFGEPRDVDVDATAANAGNTLQFKAESSDETVATVTPTALMDHGGSSQITVTPVGIGTATITVTVSDRLLNDAAQTTFMVNVSAAPLATPEVTLNSVGETQLEATWNAVPDAATYELQWKLTTTLEWGVNSVEARPDESIINRFVLEDRLTDNQAYDVRVRAKAATDSTTHQDSAWSESVTGTPVAQALNYMRVQALTVDTEITTLMPAPRGFTNTITYAASPNLPAGLTLNPTTGAISGTPTTVNPDAVTVTVTGTADGGQMATVQIRFPRVNPQPNEIDLTVIPTSVVENAPPTTITVTAMVDGTAFPQDQIVTVMVGGQSDDATEGTDYTAVDDFTITIDAGQSSGFETFTLTPIDDRDDETDEMIMLSGTASSGATVRGINLTINDDDGTPTAPTNLSFGAQKDRQLTVRWNAPDDDGGSVITDYDVRYKLTTDSSWTLLDDTMPSTETTATIMNLMNSMQYEVQVRAENMNGSGEWSLSTTATAIGAPASPAMPRLEPGSGYRQLKVSWDAPDDGGSAITDYDVRYKLTTDSSWTLLDDTMPSAETTATIMNLMNGMQYEVQVRAENMNGSGEWSLSTTATAMGAPASPAMPRLEPGSGYRQLKVSWNAPDDDGGSVITDYDVRYKLTTDSSWTLLDDTMPSTETTATIMNLMNGMQYEVQVRAENTNGSGEWSLSAMETPALTKEKLDEVNEEILPSVLNQVTEKQIAIVTDRLATISSDSHMGSLSMEEVVTDVADYLLSHHQDIQANGFDWRQALSGNNFSFALADASVSQGSMDMDDGKHSHNSGSSPVSFWGGIDYSSLEDKIEGFDLHGDIIYFNFGVDKEFTPDLVAGVLLSISNSEFDLTQGPAENTYEVDISTVNPYISWEASDDLSLWASVGYGRGQADLTDDSTDTTVSQSGDFTSFSAGGRFQLWQSEAGTALALKLDGTTAHFLDVDVQNSRLAAELSHDFSIESGVLNTALELGLLMSSADESAAELAGRLHWQGDAGFSASAQSRVLLGGGDRQEWGIGGALHYTTAGAGEGLMMSLEPSLGISNPQLLPGLWSATRSGDLAIATEAPTARLNAAIAYGFPTSDGLLTPYTDFSLSETTNTYTAGLRYGLPTGLDLDLKGMRKTSTTDDGENSILLELGSDL